MNWHKKHEDILAQKILFGFCLFDKAQENLGDVADDDEGRSQSGAAVVFYDQVIALELPEDVCILLHHLEGVAVEKWYELLFQFEFVSSVVKWTHESNISRPEHGNKEIQQEHIGDQQVDDKQQNDKPVGVDIRTGWQSAHYNLIHIISAVIFWHFGRLKDTERKSVNFTLQ